MADFLLSNRYDLIHQEPVGATLCRADCHRDADRRTQERCVATGWAACSCRSSGVCRVDAEGHTCACGARLVGVRAARLLDGLLDGLLAPTGVEIVSPLVSESANSRHVVVSDLLPRGFPDAPESGAGEREPSAKRGGTGDGSDGGARVSRPLDGVAGVAFSTTTYAATGEQGGTLWTRPLTYSNPVRYIYGCVEWEGVDTYLAALRLRGQSHALGQALDRARGLVRRGAVRHVAHGDSGWVVEGDPTTADSWTRHGHLATVYDAVDDAKARRRNFHGGT